MEEKKRKKITIVAILLIIAVGVVIFGIAYARYISRKNGSITGEISKMICNMEVNSNESNNTVVNPYCDVIVRNYELKEGNQKEITEVSVQYTITVTAKEDENGNPFILPDYYWKDSSDTIIARSVPLTGILQKDQEETQQYKIVFMNDGELDIKKYVDFRIDSVQN